MAKRTPTISVIIPNLNSPMIDRTLAAIRDQQDSHSLIEVLVVGQDKPGLVMPDELVCLVETKEPATPAVARNIGIRQSKGELICFIDADCIAAPEWLEQLTNPFVDDDVHVVGGSVSFSADDYWTLCDNISWFHPFLSDSTTDHLPLLPSLNLCVRQSVIAEVGYFNEDYPKAAGEDAEWTTRMRVAGHVLHFQRSAPVRHIPNRSDLKAILNHAYTYGSYSVKINPAFADFLNTPFFLRHWWLVIMLSPAMAFFVTVKAFITHPSLRRYLHTAPGVYISKLAWCVGLSRALIQPNTRVR